ncbi:MAG: hybrid sensor histidine kinase/response regulator [Rhizobacter sp.]|nr:hybrid sensor histidine kinase/response regulator [Bacteriovorax sp.]
MKLLNIEDSESDYQLMLHHLKKGGVSDITSVRIETEAELRAALASDNWSIVISDYNIPGFSPLGALAIIRETSQFLPFIVVSGLVGEESVADMMKAGVEDFVIKSRLERLPNVVKRAIREFEVHEQEMKSRAIAKKALEAKEEMLAIVYHDIKNPLSAIQLDAQLLELLSYKEPSEEMMGDLRVQAKRILRTVDRLKALVSDLLEHNKPIQDAEFEHNFIIRKTFQNPLHVLNEVLDSYKPLIQEKNLSIKKIIIQRKMVANFDKDRIYQVISNLLSNALKFSPMGGEIIIELEETEKGENIFTITDSGPGISEINLPHIFEKYWTGGSGNGLGLYICKSIIESHEGTIEAGVDPERGAKFWFTIPGSEKAAGTSKKDSVEFVTIRKEHKEPGQQNVYIIDDDEDLREVMTWAIEKEGYRVFSYGNAKTALEDLNLTSYPPNLIILDFHMDNMNGKEFLNIKKHNDQLTIKKCPVLMVSAAPLVVREAIDPSLYAEVLLKPLNLNRLLGTIKKYI